ncbi:hypothetical protein [Bradyrhizobium sp. RDI18]|uniref:hypothetical protein n=1 Tax=Bradyrhizobium sp. RDI18 TaxID=3367400 RepID=UPI0037153D16
MDAGIYRAAEEELYQMTDAAASRPATPACGPIAAPESGKLPLEQMRLYGYDAEAVLRGGAGTA